MDITPELDPNTLSINEKINLVKQSDGLLIDLLENETINELNLSNCTLLISLPENLKVNGYLDLINCSSLTSLPENLKVNGYLDLGNCISLTSLPENLKVKGDLYLYGCTSLMSLPKNLEVGEAIIGWKSPKFVGNSWLGQ